MKSRAPSRILRARETFWATLFAAAAVATALIAAPVAHAAPRAIENDIRIYAVDTYKSSDEVAKILSGAFGPNALSGAKKSDSAVFVGTRPSAPVSHVLSSIGKLGTVNELQRAVLVTNSGRPAPVSVGQVRGLASGFVESSGGQGSEEATRHTRDFFAGLSLKATPTSMKNGDIRIDYEQALSEITDMRRATMSGNPIVLATTHRQNLSGRGRVRDGGSLIVAGFSPDATKGFFGRKNRVVITVVTAQRD